VEAQPGEAFAEFRWPQTLRQPELGGFTPLLLDLLSDRWLE
jgi:hypothetical protein